MDFSTQLVRINHLVLSGSNGCLWLLDDDLLWLTLLTLELQSLTALQLDLTWLHQLDLHMDTAPQCTDWSQFTFQLDGKFSTAFFRQ